MSGFRNILLDPASSTLDVAGRMRVGQITTLFDGKTLNADDLNIWENTGTGTGLWADNQYDMSVTAGQYMIRRSRYYLPYYSGKTQVIEITADKFHDEAGVLKRSGYFSSNAVAPYDSNKDGIWIETDGTTRYIVSSRSGVETSRHAFADWSGYSQLQSYDWSKFTVILIDFLWLGGAGYRVFIKTPTGFVLAHSDSHAGVGTSTIFASPNQCIRYEIRSTGGAGSYRPICSMAGTEGSVNAGEGKEYSSPIQSTDITLATIGVTYPLVAIRKAAGYRDRMVSITDISSLISSNSDRMVLTVQLNPTLSAGPTYAAVSNSGVEAALGNGAITVTAAGVILANRVISQNSIIPSGIMHENILNHLGSSIADVSDVLVLCGTPITATVACSSGMIFKVH